MRCQASRQQGIALALLWLGLHAAAAHGSRPGQDAVLNAFLAPPEVCESKTINYITHILPQQCLRTSWTAAPTATANVTASSGTAIPTATAGRSTETAPSNDAQQKQAVSQEKVAPKHEQEPEDPDNQDFATSSFMSFEEWKEMMLRKSGQDPANIKGRKPSEHRAERDPAIAHGEFDGIGEEGEISLDFDALSEKVSEITSSSSGEAPPHTKTDVKEEPVLYDDGKTQYYRSKDAGKTCKERFSYSSFDAGATVLKTNPGAKNAKAILVENKDSYMLLECRNKNKFVIVELSDDILVDTVVLANFEFFSSMIRKFRVSVSDRYPMKLDKWVDLGTFEARNSRDIQPFLVEHPQIYTKYIRIEFLTHYGTEYYCPVSLLRVHGTRMLDSWKEHEQDQGQDDEVEQIDAAIQEPAVEANQTAEPIPAEPVPSDVTEENIPRAQDLAETGLSPWQPLFQYDLFEPTCALRSPTTGEPTPVLPDIGDKPGIAAANGESVSVHLSKASIAPETPKSNGSSVPAPSQSTTAQSQSTGSSSPSVSASSAPPQQAASNSNSSTASSSPSPKQPNARTDAADGGSSASSRTTGTSTSSSSPPRNKTSAGSSASASPTVQESFFKTVTKRLQHLESNTSLSLQYIEEQSRFLQDALLKMEKKQISRVDSFLDTLNKTVLAELRTVRTQYDQIWQSTVIALETQREQSQREIVALSGRLTVLADEVVFQKRMAILQSVLLLSCLILVIFSRGGGGSFAGYGPGPALVNGRPSSFDLGTPLHLNQHRHAREDSTSTFAPTLISSPSASGAAAHYASSQHNLHYRNGAGTSDKTLPLTPTSQFSREATPLIHVDGVDVPFYDVADSPSPPTPPPSQHQQQPKSPPQQPKRQRRRKSGGSKGKGHINGNGNGSSGGSGNRSAAKDGAEQDVDAELSPEPGPEEPAAPLSAGRLSMSQMQMGGVRKPLPALPEDQVELER
ncbi:UNC-like C-terminal-domain-containing protein [Lasiosphaeris hirsuta]|uniref:UNC-like C-terminal-domain-containing protein n=1 Tax=Lasiosphaeris hirsuta TaxID=260670 RepID=A0AA40A7T2_9PEZI|nr:UNC-like C-terminal-domain-containing protein [Lasiosphaeris hirsuta]